LALLLLIEWLPAPPNRYDEGLILTGATRILHGEIPYRDFWTVYGPGQIYLLALVFKLFSPSILVARIVDIHFKLLALIAGRYLVANLSGSQKWADYSLLVLSLWLGNFMNFDYPAVPALALSLLGLAALTVGQDQERPRLILCSGILAGFTTLFRHDFGAYLVMASLTSAVLFQLRHPRAHWLRPLIIYCLGVGTIVIPVASFFLFRVPLEKLYFPLIEYPSHVFPGVRRLPYPIQAAFLFPFIPPLLALIRWRNVPTRRIGLLVPMWVLFLTAQVSVRSDRLHLLPFYFGALLLLAPADRQLTSWFPSWTRYRTWAAVVLVLLTADSFGPRLQLIQALFSPSKTPEIARAHGVLLRGDQAQALEQISRLSSPGDRIFVGNDRHDRLHMNDALFYFLSELPPAVFAHEMDPGTTPSAACQRRIVGELERSQPRFAVRVDHLSDNLEPNASAQSSGVALLDPYLDERFSEIGHYGDYHVLLRSARR
jgi:hypothetical protein